MCAREPVTPDQAAKYSLLRNNSHPRSQYMRVGGFSEPDVVVVNDAPGGEDDGEGIDHERGIEVLQVAGAHDDCGNQEPGQQRSPGTGANAVRRTSELQGNSLRALPGRGIKTLAFTRHKMRRRSGKQARNPGQIAPVWSRKKPKK